MHSKNNNEYRPPFRNTPVNLNDPMLQNITMMALLSRPGIEKQLEEAINMIEGISNIIRTMRSGLDSFHASMREVNQHVQRLPNKQHAYGPPKNENVHQQPSNTNNFGNPPQYNNIFNSFPLDDANNNLRNNG